MLETEYLGYKGAAPDGENPGKRSSVSTRRNREGKGRICKVGRGGMKEQRARWRCRDGWAGRWERGKEGKNEGTKE
jgi:hypothetical protein